MLFIVYWKNRKRPSGGMTTVDADSEQAAAEECKRQIETKYHWQGKCEITSCKLAARQPGDAK